MSLVKIKPTVNEGVQLSEGKHFLMVSKFRINRGENTGQPVYTVQMSEIVPNYDRSKAAHFDEIKSFLLSQKQFDAWIALLVQISNRKLEDKPNAS